MLKVAGPEGAVVDTEVEAVAAGLEANSVDDAFAGGVDGVVEGAAIVTAIVTGEAQALIPFFDFKKLAKESLK